MKTALPRALVDGGIGPYAVLGLVAGFLVLHTVAVLAPFPSGFYDTRRILQIVLGVGVSLAVVASRRLRDEIMTLVDTLPRPVRWAVPAIVAVGLVSAVRAPIPVAGVRDVALLSSVALLGLAVAATHRALGVRFERTVLVSLVGAGLVYVVTFALLRHVHIDVMGIDAVASRPWQFFYGWSNSRFFGQVGVWTLPLLVAAPIALRDRPVLTRATCWLVAVAWWALIIEAGGRGSIVLTVVAAGVAAAVLGRTAWSWARAAGVTLAGGTALWFALSALQHLVYAEGPVPAASTSIERAIRRGAGDRARMDFWEQAVELIVANPLLGAGPEHFAYHTRVWAAHPHNAVLQIASEWGVPVAIALVGLGAWALYAWVGRSRNERTSLAERSVVVTALTAATLGAGVLAMVDGVLVTPASQVMLALVAGWMWSIHVEHVSASPARGGGMRAHVIVAAVAIACATTLVWTAGDHLWSPHETQQAQVERHDLDVLHPRFWLQGQLFDP